MTVRARSGTEDRIGSTDPAARLSRFLDETSPGEYIAILAYFRPGRERHEALRGLRRRLQRRTGVAITAEYGPRYLHSTGQLHKGGPATGRFLVLTADEGADREIPGRPHSFRQLHRAQAEGDIQALARRNRPVLQVELGADPEAGLRELYALAADSTAKTVAEAR